MISRMSSASALVTAQQISAGAGLELTPPEHVADPKSIDAMDKLRIEEFAFRFGRSYDSYLATDLQRQYFWSSGRRGLVSFVRSGRHVVAIGGLMAPEDHWADLLGELLAFVRRQSYTLTFFNVDRQQAEAFRQHGFQTTKVGEDSLIDLAECRWKGKDFEWVRRQSNFCLRQGLICQEVPLADTSVATPALFEELMEVSRLFLKGKPQGGQMRYFVSRFDPQKLIRHRLFVARASGGQGRTEAFIVCNPCRNGRMWAVEVFRQRPDAVRGAVSFLIHQALQSLQADGVPWASLCLVPLLRCDKPLEGDSWLGRKLMVLGHKYAGAFYDTQGMFHFKSRFRPRFEDRYACAWPKMTLLSIRAGIMLWGVDRFNPFRVAWRLIQQFYKRDSRSTMARSEDR